MKFSESWLREWVSPELDTDALVEQITMAGLEVDSVEPVAGEFTGVIVGEILAAEQHPDADKLRVCQVAGHPDGSMQVVCGAPNARTGIKIPFATVGAVLPGNFKIKKAKLRGIESHGMLCAQTELQAGDNDEGLWELPLDAPVGSDLNQYLGLNDTIIEVDLTPNRSDCLSIRGLARDVGVLNRMAVDQPAIGTVPELTADSFPVSLEADDACPRYCGRVIRKVDLTRPSPLWLQEKLRRSGIRSIDAVVDVTNYVMLELGQPMHAFDLDKLEKGIRVRMARVDEAMTLLDGQEIKLNADTLIIADRRGPLAMAGIMGGEHSGVSPTTTNIFLESAFFKPLALAGRARAYGLHTDSSHRFERGVDYNLAPLAIERATRLLLDIVGGEAGPAVTTELADQLPPCRQVRLRRKRVESGLGMALSDEDIIDILTRLGLEKLSSDGESWTFAVPSYRFDIAIEEDLLEELARIHGYDRLPIRPLKMDAVLTPHSEMQLGLAAVRGHLVARGYQEAITYSFIDPQLQQFFGGSPSVSLKNPISADMGVMRNSLLPGLAKALLHNINRQQARVRLFETGQRFVSNANGLTQEPMVAGLIYGTRQNEGWANDSSIVDFYDIKGDLESLLALTGNAGAYSFRRAGDLPALHPGQSAEILLNGEPVGLLGALHPEVRKQLDIPRPVLVFELTQKAVASARLPRFSGTVSRFPEVKRDMAIVVDKEIAMDAIGREITAAAGDCLKDLKVFDVYVGEGIDPKRKSLAFSLTFQHPSRTLTEEEINTSMAQVLTRLEGQFNVALR
jgi:phenylalanyl-tRNA synthetase beta chain